MIKDIIKNTDEQPDGRDAYGKWEGAQSFHVLSKCATLSAPARNHQPKAL